MQLVSVNNVYASGSRRLLAWIIDRLIIGAVIALVFNWDIAQYDDAWFDIHFWSWSIGLSAMSQFILLAIYNAGMEASPYQGSIGKIALGIKVVDLNGERVSFSKSLLRNLSKSISWFIFCIGYAMIVFDEKKQGLHDKIADTYIVQA